MWGRAGVLQVGVARCGANGASSRSILEAPGAGMVARGWMVVGAVPPQHQHRRARQISMPKMVPSLPLCVLVQTSSHWSAAPVSDDSSPTKPPGEFTCRSSSNMLMGGIRVLARPYSVHNDRALHPALRSVWTAQSDSETTGLLYIQCRIDGARRLHRARLLHLWILISCAAALDRAPPSPPMPRASFRLWTHGDGGER